MLRLIAIFKLVKVLVLLASLATVFNLVRQDDPAHTVISWALTLHVDPNNHYLRTVLAAIFHLDPKQLALLTIGTASYAILFFIEAIGLWWAKPWAEYLTIVATASFIPVEGHEIFIGISVAKTVMLVFNVAIVVYLVFHVRRSVVMTCSTEVVS